jgi:hypothetical protein
MKKQKGRKWNGEGRANGGRGKERRGKVEENNKSDKIRKIEGRRHEERKNHPSLPVQETL